MYSFISHESVGHTAGRTLERHSIIEYYRSKKLTFMSFCIHNETIKQQMHITVIIHVSQNKK